jgi:hypothetical protein
MVGLGTDVRNEEFPQMYLLNSNAFSQQSRISEERGLSMNLTRENNFLKSFFYNFQLFSDARDCGSMCYKKDWFYNAGPLCEETGKSSFVQYTSKLLKKFQSYVMLWHQVLCLISLIYHKNCVRYSILIESKKLFKRPTETNI